MAKGSISKQTYRVCLVVRHDDDFGEVDITVVGRCSGATLFSVRLDNKSDNIFFLWGSKLEGKCIMWLYGM